MEVSLNRRVVITGLGLVTPVGIGVEDSWAAICSGKSGIAEITHFDASAFPSKIATSKKSPQPNFG